jgi:hypothetical protein
MWYSVHLLATLVSSAFPDMRVKSCRVESSTWGASGLPSEIGPIVSILFNDRDRYRHLMDGSRETAVRISMSADRQNKHDHRDRKTGQSIGDDGVVVVNKATAGLACNRRSTPSLEVLRAIGAIP